MVGFDIGEFRDKIESGFGLKSHTRNVGEFRLHLLSELNNIVDWLHIEADTISTEVKFTTINMAIGITYDMDDINQIGRMLLSADTFTSRRNAKQACWHRIYSTYYDTTVGMECLGGCNATMFPV